jgi:hypothetical protein
MAKRCLNSSARRSLYVCWQDKRWVLKKGVSRISGPDLYTAVAVPSVAELTWLTSCVSLDDRVACKRYCIGLFFVATRLQAPGCEVIVSAGCIPAVIECLHRWPADAGVVSGACYVLCSLARNRASVTALTSVPGIVDTLQAADASGLAYDNAADTLDLLGFSAAEVSE